MSRMSGLVTALLLALCAAPAPATEQQQDPRAAPVFNAQHPVNAILEAAKAQGKALVFQLQGGVSYTGRIKEVGPQAVIVTELRGKEFFDAWIPLASIVALEERVRLR